MFNKLRNIAAPPEFRFWGGDILGGRLVGGPGCGAPRTPENFENFQKKISQENCKKWIILGDFLKKIKNPALNFRALDEKPNCLGNYLRRFSNISLKKHKKCIILVYFQSIFKTLR